LLNIHQNSASEGKTGKGTHHMTDKELHRLGRRELLELLLEQGKQMEALAQELEETKEKLRARTIAIEEAGSLAEASLRLSGVFQAAEEAASLYLENIRRRAEVAE
jgi:hypothetical protein